MALSLEDGTPMEKLSPHVPQKKRRADLNIDMLVVEEEDLASFAKSNVFVASSVDHSWLFPKCSASGHFFQPVFNIPYEIHM